MGGVRWFWLAGLALSALAASAEAPQTADWPVTEGAAGGGRYSPLTDINWGNVASLRVAWTYHHGDSWTARLPPIKERSSAFESTPIVVDGRLLFTTPRNRVIALDPETGRELWTFDPQLERGGIYANMWVNRGVAHWRDRSAAGPCSTRVFLATLDARLIALDAATGQPCADFGANGTVNLLDGIAPVYDAREYNVSSPVTVVGDVIAVGSSIPDTLRPDAPPGDVRGFDARTGALRWTFHTIPHEGDVGRETWEGDTALAGAANVWSTITADLARGWLFLPVSTPSPDFYGGDRPGENWFSDSVVALDAATGRRIWHFQTVHHDLWDYDLAAPPVAVSIALDRRPGARFQESADARHAAGARRADGRIDVIAQATKPGFLFVLDRETGEPVFPVREVPVPASDVPGERAWPTQPVPSAPPALVPQRLDPDDLYAPTPAHRNACREQLAGLRNQGLFTPPSMRGSVLYPFTGGGANWSGASFDPVRQILVVPVQNLVHLVRLDEVGERTTGGGSAVRPLSGTGLRALWWLFTGRGAGDRYRVAPLGGRVVFEHDGVPCNQPPWGMLVGVDLARGAIAWSVSTSTRDGDPGSFGYGPALVTASGLVFHGGTRDPVLRVHDIRTGDRIATFDLPAGLHAGPISYKLAPDRKQFLVVAPGGHAGVSSPIGDAVVAYTLP